MLILSEFTTSKFTLPGFTTKPNPSSKFLFQVYLVKVNPSLFSKSTSPKLILSEFISSGFYHPQVYTARVYLVRCKLGGGKTYQYKS